MVPFKSKIGREGVWITAGVRDGVAVETARFSAYAWLPERIGKRDRPYIPERGHAVP